MTLTRAWRFIERRLFLGMVLGAMLIAPVTASAAVLTYYPSGSSGGDNDLNDLDHQYYYAWTLTGLPSVPAGTQVTSAYLTFKNLYNWDNTANMLYMDLFDASSSGGTILNNGSGDANGGASGGVYSTVSRYAQDATGSPVTTFNDKFDGSNSLVNGTKIDLSEHAFLPGDSVNSIRNDPSQSTDIQWLKNLLYNAGLPTVDAEFGAANPQWSFSANGSGWDYTYNFTDSQMNTLTNYINNGGNITLAFDPDCHFFNDGVSFTMITTSSPGATAVPEPASLMLLGTGLLLTASRYRRRRAGKASKKLD